MTDNMKSASTMHLMTEAKRLHDRIYNLEIGEASDRERLELIFTEINSRGYSVLEMETVIFIDAGINTN